MPTRTPLHVLVIAAAALFAAPHRAVSPVASTFDAESDSNAWRRSGGAKLDRTKSRGGDDGGSLRVEAGATATLKLRDSDGAGKVSLWVYDDGTSPKDPKVRRGGPQWGVVTTGGRRLVVGPIYAPYLAGDKTYAVAEYSPGKDEQPWYKVSYLGLPRKVGWRHWTFDFDADKGLRITCDGKDVNAKRKRFDWNRSDVGGFAGVVIVGDMGKGRQQTVWVDDVTVSLGGVMKVKPTPPPPPPPVVPASDPKLDGPAPKLNREVMSRRPRLLFGPDDIAKLRKFAGSDAGKRYMDVLSGYVGVSRAPKQAKFLTDATDGQRQGYWRLPTVALHYVLTGDKDSFDRTVGFMQFLLELDHWETGSERDSGMSAANIMIGAALAFDWLHDDLDSEFREKFRRKLLHHARAMYHGGHLKKNPGTHYWQNDPQNNHRWHRNAGLALCVLAAYSGAEGEHWILAKTKQELDYVARWLPDDGTSHEGPTYMVFGGSHLLIAMHAADRCFDADYLQQPFFKRVGPYLSQSLAPDRSALFAYGDSGGGLGAYANFLYKTAAVHRQADVQALLDGKWQQSPRSFDVSAWMALIWRDPALKPVGLGDVPTRSFFDDIGLAYIRDGWDDESVAAMFKCGPFGGYRLNAFRNSHDMRYINVAHDDPDANSLVLWKSGSYLAETDRYSKHKQSANHNTVLVNGMGQMARGRPEGGVWSQPGGDMTTMGVVTAWKPGKDVVIIEGEAAGSYLAYTDRKTKRTRPALQRFRRTFIWVEGRYVLVLDDIRAPSAVEVSWLIQGPKLSVQDKNALRFTLAHADATCPFQVAADHDRVAQKVVTSSADHRGKALGWQQLQLTVEARTVRFASVYDLWGRGDLRVTLSSQDKAHASVTVRGDGLEDKWQWQAAKDSASASTIRGVDRRGDVLGGIKPGDEPERRE